MSFSYDVKKEICLNIDTYEKRSACLYGMLLFSKQFDQKKTVFHTEHPDVASLFSDAVEEIAGIRKSECIEFSETLKKNNSVLYTSVINSPVCLEKLMKIYKTDILDFRRINTFVIKEYSINCFVSGVFLASGTITDPNKEYHLEYTTPYYNLCRDFISLMSKNDLPLRITERKGSHVMYLKESETIEDNLTFMGAVQSTLEIMNIKILKDVRNKANRIANCDSANIEKTIKASAEQIKDIELIINKKGVDYLSDDLQEIALLRQENPELSLRELGSMLSKPIGRSGANHRMKKIAEMAEEIRNSDSGGL